MPDLVTSILAVAVGLGITVLLHESGHFIAAKLFGVRVDVFSIGFGPRLWGRKRGVTDYRISVLPVGGYVKMAGDNPTEERAGAPDEFLSKPRWQRAAIALAGPMMNVLLAVALTASLFVAGTTRPIYVDDAVEVAGVLKDSPAEKAGLRPGDRVVELNGRLNPKWEEALLELMLPSIGDSFNVVVERGEQRIPLAVRAVPVRTEWDAFSLLGYPREPVVVNTVTVGMPADRSGLKPNDEILAVNGEPVLSPLQFRQKIQELGGVPISLSVRRGDRTLHLEMRPVYGDPGDGVPRWQMGFSFRFATIHKTYSLPAALNRAWWFNLRLTREIVHVVVQLFQGRVSLKQLEGPVGIARQSGQAARRGLPDFVNLMAVISLNLGVLNLLPIPILDGGHILLLSIEGLLRRDLSVTLKERFVQVGLVFLLVIFAIVMYNDVLKLLPNR